MVKGFFKSPFVGAAGMVVGVLWQATTSGWELPDNKLAFLVFVVSLIQAAWSLVTENMQLKSAMEPKFEIVFSPDGDQNSPPFLESREYVEAPRGVGMTATRKRVRKYRIGIKNRSSATVPSVRVVLASCTPVEDNIRVGHYLPVMGGTGATADIHPTSDGEPSAFFDVAREVDDAAKTPMHFAFCFAGLDLQRNLDYGSQLGEDKRFEYRIRLRAEGAGYSCHRDFVLSKKFNADTGGTHQLKMEAL